MRVALKASEQALEPTDIACRLAALGAVLFLVHVIELPDVTPVDAPVPDLETSARRIL